jgi:polyribonucleotide nucleotidyltransferase
MIPEYAQKKIKSVSIPLGNGTLTLETGRLAEQAGGAVVVQFGDSIVLSTVVGDKKPKEDLPFFPLTVDYEERMYAAGKIPGGFIKREGRPTEAAILAARLTDRPLRPLFPKGYRAPVQVMTTVFSADQKNDPDILSIIGASAALTISPIPFDGPVGAVRIGYVDGQITVNPSFEELETSELDLVVAGTEDAIMMVEGHADQISEERLLEAIGVAHENIRRIVAAQHELAAQVTVEKWAFTAPSKDEVLVADLKTFLGDRLKQSVRNPDKVVRLESTSGLESETIAALMELDDSGVSRYKSADVSDAYQSLLKQEVRNGILEDGIRPDGRTTEEIRPIWADVSYLPRAHGSAIFTRGQTQVLTVATLGSTAEEQRLDSISPEDRKRYIHHYNFPPYSVGEARQLRGASRRDIGHGALAERALIPVLPSSQDFPYTMRLVSEVVSSNGSTSMASVCGSSLALMDAGVPISKPVAGVAMGLILDAENDRFTVLTDIQGMEDALGDMDFKVAGTDSGVTAIQMDIKVKGITLEIMGQALRQAHTGRQFILGKMHEALAAPRTEMSLFAPKVETLKIDSGKIGAVIGPGGKMIRAIQEETNSKIDIQDDGTVSISSPDAAGREAAKAKILGLTTEIKVERGEKYTGKVVSIMPFGAFVEILPGKDGLVHISEISEDPDIRVDRVEDVLTIGDEIEVQVIEVAPNGKVSLSRRAAITGVLPEPKPARPRDDRGPRRPSGEGGGGFRPR